VRRVREDAVVTDVIQILAWPTAAVAIVIVLRRPLGDLILSIKSLRYRHIEVEFGKAIEKAGKEAEKLLTKEAGRGGGAGAGTGAAARKIELTLRDLAATSPATAVVESWRGVEAYARDALAARGIGVDGDHPTPYKQLQDLLVQNGVLDASRADLFHELRLLRNKVVHAPAFAISTPQAMQYVELAGMLRETLQCGAG
jgi:hypothetical protein